MTLALLAVAAVLVLGAVLPGRCTACGGSKHVHARTAWAGPIRAWSPDGGTRWCGLYLGPIRLHRKWQDDLPPDAQPCLVAHWETPAGGCRRVAALYVRGLGPLEPRPSWCGGQD